MFFLYEVTPITRPTISVAYVLLSTFPAKKCNHDLWLKEISFCQCQYQLQYNQDSTEKQYWVSYIRWVWRSAELNSTRWNISFKI